MIKSKQLNKENINKIDYLEKYRISNNYGRVIFVTVILTIIGITLIIRAGILQLNKETGLFLQKKANQYLLYETSLNATRGMILDRNGEPLAVSAPIISFSAKPSQLKEYQHYYPQIANILDIPVNDLEKMIDQNQSKQFIWLKRHVISKKAASLLRLNIPGINYHREYRRYYPESEITAQLLGFTNIDDKGQEGIELKFNQALTGQDGLKSIMRDRYNHTIDYIQETTLPIAGQDIKLTIDRRIQYIAYQALKKAVLDNKASSGFLILVDAKEGEILALVNQPSSNPNDMAQRKSHLIKNIAVTDVFEPGSTIKPLVVAAGLESGRWTPQTVVDTSMGVLKVGSNKVTDISNNGKITLTEALMKSSNIAMTLVLNSIPPEDLYKLYESAGIGKKTNINFVGEASGKLGNLKRWKSSPFEYATKGFGYGFQVNALQLAQIYSIFANNGIFKPLKITLNQDNTSSEEKTHRVISPKTANQVVNMLEAVTQSYSGQKAAVKGFRVAGKSGTARKLVDGKYSSTSHRSFFAGIAPASDPRYVLVVMIDDPKAGKYYGGAVCAPIFSEVMESTLYFFGVTPDSIQI